MSEGAIGSKENCMILSAAANSSTIISAYQATKGPRTKP